MSDLFSSFNPNINTFMGMIQFNWISMTVILFLPTSFWVQKSLILESMILILKNLEKEFSSLFSFSKPPGSMIIFQSIFFFIFLNNFLGLFPFIFTSTSHFSVTLSMSLSLFLGLMLSQLTNNLNQILCHMVPMGTPTMLLPLMVIIETISYTIRPLTLSIRLAANMIAGHLLLTLLGSLKLNFNLITFILLMVICSLLILEMAVSMIQSYVFSILSTLYFSEMNYIEKKKN